MRAVLFDLWKLVPPFLTLGLVNSSHSQPSIVEVDWQRPGTDFSHYDAFLIKPLDLSDVKVLKPAWEQDNPEVWSFERGTAEEIQALFMRSMVEALSAEDGYRIADKAGEDVLQLEVEFLSITPYVRPGSAQTESGSPISTLGSGDVVVSAELRDSMTGSLLVVVEGERQIGNEYKELSRESHIENLESTFALWGRHLRTWMDDRVH